MKEQVDAALDVVRGILGEDLEAAYLYGSAVVGGLRPASDVDLLVVSKRRTTADERGALVEDLTPLSDRRVRPPSWRPIELTIVTLPDVKPWRYPAKTDFQWGEWLRGEFEAGRVPEPHVNPDLAVLMAQVRQTSRALLGRPAGEVLDAVPQADVDRAMRDSVPALLADLDTDTTNVLLTLARIRHTLATQEFATKDKAADWAIARLAPTHQRLLEHARDVYLGTRTEDWAARHEDVSRLAVYLADQIAVG